MKKTSLRRVSKKRAHELAIYNSLKKYILAQRYFCEYPATNGCPSCMKPATEVHHMRGRAGAMLNNVTHWLPICREHHRYLHDHGKEARALGLLLCLMLFAGCAYQGTPPGAMPPCQSMDCVYVANGWLPK